MTLSPMRLLNRPLDVIPYQAIRWPCSTIQRRTITVDSAAVGGSLWAVVIGTSQRCPVNRIGRCRRDAAKAGSRKPSRMISVYELLHNSELKWFHSDLLVLEDVQTTPRCAQDGYASPVSAATTTTTTTTTNTMMSLSSIVPTMSIKRPISEISESSPNTPPCAIDKSPVIVGATPRRARGSSEVSAEALDAAARLGYLVSSATNSARKSPLVVLHLHEIFAGSREEVKNLAMEFEGLMHEEVVTTVEFLTMLQRAMARHYSAEGTRELLEMVRLGGEVGMAASRWVGSGDKETMGQVVRGLAEAGQRVGVRGRMKEWCVDRVARFAQGWERLWDERNVSEIDALSRIFRSDELIVESADCRAVLQAPEPSSLIPTRTSVGGGIPLLLLAL